MFELFLVALLCASVVGDETTKKIQLPSTLEDDESSRKFVEENLMNKVSPSLREKLMNIPPDLADGKDEAGLEKYMNETLTPDEVKEMEEALKLLIEPLIQQMMMGSLGGADFQESLKPVLNKAVEETLRNIPGDPLKPADEKKESKEEESNLGGKKEEGPSEEHEPGKDEL